MVHHVAEHAVFVSRQLDRLAVDRSPRRTRIDTQIAALQRRARMTRRTPHQRTQTRQQFFGDKRLRQIVIGAGIKARNLLAQRSRAVRISTGISLPALRHFSSTRTLSNFGKPRSRTAAS